VSATAAALGLSQQAVEQAIKAIANPNGLKVVWLSGQACGGCIEAASNMFIGEADVTDANGDNVYDNLGIAQVKALFADSELKSSTTVEDVIIDVIDLKLMPVIDTPSGDLWTSVLYKYMYGANPGTFVVVVEGSVPVDLNMDHVDYCIIANKYWDGNKVLGIGEALVKLAQNGAAAFIAYGTCASYGNIPAAKNRKYIPGNPPKYEHTFAMGVGKYLQSKGITTPVVNIPNCPGHPEALALTVVDVLTHGLSAVAANLDKYGRPKSSLHFGFPLYSHTIHQDCPRINEYYDGVFSLSYGYRSERAGCLEKLGCQGQWVNAPCHTLGWNRQYSKTSCIKAGMPCFGCSEPGYPDRTLQYKY
jgi:hydrogenase small subunit